MLLIEKRNSTIETDCSNSNEKIRRPHLEKVARSMVPSGIQIKTEIQGPPCSAATPLLVNKLASITSPYEGNKTLYMNGKFSW